MSAQCYNLPIAFNSGDSVTFTAQYSSFPTTAWTAKLWLYRNDVAGGTPTGYAATVEGVNFRFTITATQSAALAPGSYEWAIQTTNIANAEIVKTAQQGTIACLPNYMVAQEPTKAQQMVALYEAVIRQFANTKNRRVNFAGQEFEYANIEDYQKQLVYWQAQVNQEQAAINRLRGGRDPQRITTQFVQPFCGGPFNGTWPWNYPQ